MAVRDYGGDAVRADLDPDYLVKAVRPLLKPFLDDGGRRPEAEVLFLKSDDRVVLRCESGWYEAMLLPMKSDASMAEEGEAARKAKEKQPA